MPPDDSDVDVPLTSSRGGSSVSGSRSDYDLESASEVSDAPKKKTAANKKKAAQSQSSSRPTLAKSQTGDSGARSGGSNAFLTAAERRAKEKKEEKTSAESPYEFLKDVKDVCYYRLYACRVISNSNRKTGIALVNQVMTRERSLYQSQRGPLSRPLRNRYAYAA